MSDDTWLFKVTDRVGGEPTSIYITTTGEIVSVPEAPPKDETEADANQVEEVDDDEAVETLLRDCGHPVPETVYGVVFATSEHTNPQSEDKQLRTLVDSAAASPMQ